MKKFQPSKYQQAIYDFIQTGTGNAVVDAVAGSGKSTTIVNALNLIPENESVLFLAFNKAIVEELKIKLSMNANVEVLTLHGLGARSLMKTFKCSVNGNKYISHLNEGFRLGLYKPVMKLQMEETQDYKNNIKALINLVRVNLCSSVSQFEDIAFKHGLSIIDNECEIAAAVVRWGYVNMNEIDFTDMIYFPVMKKIKMTQYDWVFIDESQDLNSAQRELFQKCIKPTGRFIAVGDPRQAIYGFAGADAESFDKLKALPNVSDFPLSVCYRCDTEIIDLAKTLVPQIESKENADKGIIDYKASHNDVKDADMILCRVTAPLAELCMHYISNGIKAYIKGREMGSNLIGMLEKTNRIKIEDALDVFGLELLKIEARSAKALKCSLESARETNQYINYSDRIKTLVALSEGLKTVNQLISRIKHIFSEDNKKGICLSTIHKSKGLESERVFILRQDKLYNSRSMQIDWMAEQEKNLVYVAYTRAKHYLGFITDF